MTTHTLPQGTLAPFRPVQRKANSNKSKHRAHIIFSRAPASMGYGRPAQATAAD